MIEALQDLRWQEAPRRAITACENNLSMLAGVVEALEKVAAPGLVGIYCEPPGERLFLAFRSPYAMAADGIACLDAVPRRWKEAVHCLPEDTLRESVRPDASRLPWGSAPPDPWQEKEAYSKTLRGWGQATGLLDGPVSSVIPGGPNVLVGTLGGGLLGAGLGYGGGMLAERFLPESWRRKRLSRTMAVLGAIGGAMPGASMMAMNRMGGLPWTDNNVVRQPLDVPEAFMPKLPGGADNPDYHPDMPYVPHVDYQKASEALGDAILPEAKEAIASYTGYEFMDLPEPMPVPVDEVGHAMWYDPHIAQQLPMPMRAATTGLVDAAWYDRQRRMGSEANTDGARLVWPRDIARITAGMGSGYLSGALVGKTLGALFGVPASVQDRLKQTGLLAGAISSIIPIAFGAR